MKNIYSFVYVYCPSGSSFNFLFESIGINESTVDACILHCVSLINEEYNENKIIENYMRHEDGDNYIESLESIEDVRDRHINFITSNRNALLTEAHSSMYINYTQVYIVKQDIITF